MSKTISKTFITKKKKKLNGDGMSEAHRWVALIDTYLEKSESKVIEMIIIEESFLMQIFFTIVPKK